jgi:xylulokinase
MPVHTINTMPKMLWLKEHKPEIWKKAARFVLYEDFIIHRLTGSPTISHCLASRTQMYDIHTRGWSGKMLAALELDEIKLSPIRESGFACGEMKTELAARLGLSNNPLVVTGGHDQACGALGAGNVMPGQASVSSGTAEVVEVTMAEPVLNEALFKANISIYSHVVPGRYVAMTLNHSGGILLRWFRDNFGQEEIRQAQKVESDAYDLLLKGATLEPSGMLLLPHFSGSGTPLFDTNSRGAILGLTLSATKQDVMKAIVEGLTYELRVNTDLLRENGIEINELRAIGGGARSDFWLHLKADILKIPVQRVRITDAACWGAAVLAGIGAGVYYDAAEAAGRALVLENIIHPDSVRSKLFDESYELYTQVYPAVKSINDKLAARMTSRI